MPKRLKPKPDRATQAKPDVADLPLSPPRIVGGHLRGRKLLYSGDPLTRPMKDRVREAVFNLVGPDVKDKQALDLFAGTGALGFEAISRGAARATFLERYFPTADLIRKTAAELGVADECQVIAANTFIWAKRLFENRLGEGDSPILLRGLRKIGTVPGGSRGDLPNDTRPWVVFVSPPWSLFRERAAEMVELVGIFVERSPAGSVIVVEADEQFDFATLPQPDAWDVREYPPAVVGIFRRGDRVGLETGG